MAQSRSHTGHSVTNFWPPLLNPMANGGRTIGHYKAPYRTLSMLGHHSSAQPCPYIYRCTSPIYVIERKRQTNENRRDIETDAAKYKPNTRDTTLPIVHKYVQLPQCVHMDCTETTKSKRDEKQEYTPLTSVREKWRWYIILKMGLHGARCSCI